MSSWRKRCRRKECRRKKNRKKFIAFKNAFDISRLANSRHCHNQYRNAKWCTIDVRKMCSALYVYLWFWIHILFKHFLIHFVVVVVVCILVSTLLWISHTTAFELVAFEPFHFAFFCIITLFEWILCLPLHTFMYVAQWLTQYATILCMLCVSDVIWSSAMTRHALVCVCEDWRNDMQYLHNLHMWTVKCMICEMMMPYPIVICGTWNE